MTTIFQYSAATDEGKKRTNNEDTFFADSDLGLWFVADGMGGHESGEVASSIVKEQVSKSIRKGAKLTDAIQDAHHAVVNAGQEGIGSVGMGSTIVALLAKGNDYEIAWVGDSRAYLWDGKLSQLSHDHSLVQEMIDRDLLSPEEATGHRHRHIITQSLGYVNLKDVQVDHIAGQFLRNQKILLCSDGLNDEVGEEQIADIINNEDGEKAIVDKLIETALLNGGGDNVTVLLISAPDDAPNEHTNAVDLKNKKAGLHENLRSHTKLILFILGIALAVWLGSQIF